MVSCSCTCLSVIFHYHCHCHCHFHCYCHCNCHVSRLIVFSALERSLRKVGSLLNPSKLGTLLLRIGTLLLRVAGTSRRVPFWLFSPILPPLPLNSSSSTAPTLDSTSWSLLLCWECSVPYQKSLNLDCSHLENRVYLIRTVWSCICPLSHSIQKVEHINIMQRMANQLMTYLKTSYNVDAAFVWINFGLRRTTAK